LPAALTDFYAQHSNLVQSAGINAILALSLYLTLAAGMLSLANAAFMAIGAYTAALLTLHAGWPFPLVLGAGGSVAALTALPLGVPVLRLRGVFLAIATIGFGEVVRIFFINWSYAGGALGLNGIPRKTALWQIYLLLAVLLFVLWRLRRSRTGYAMEAIREDEAAAATAGVDVTRYKVGLFVAGAFVAGVAGGLQAHLRYIVDPNDYGFSAAVDILVYAVVGGANLFLGPVLGAFLITALPDSLRGLKPLGVQPGPDRQLVSGAVLLLVVLFLPSGLISVYQWRWQRWRTRLGLMAGRVRAGP
jgi:branched-chain amino acid transport system permease protein